MSIMRSVNARRFALAKAGAYANLCWLFSSAFGGDYGAFTNAYGTFHLFRARPEEVSLWWKGTDGVPMRTFQAVEAHLRSLGKEPVLLMNGGIFEPGGIPSGLHIEDGKELLPVNLEEGIGNFYLKPNGVFCIDARGAHILRSEDYAKARLEPRMGLQSGPLLLNNGELHPAFKPGSDSRLHRNGVGVLPDGNVLFAITDLPSRTRVNLYEFAMLFKRYGCRNALFLDGDLSVMAVARQHGKLAPVDSADVESRELAPGIRTGNHFGAILAVSAGGEGRRAGGPVSDPSGRF